MNKFKRMIKLAVALLYYATTLPLKKGRHAMVVLSYHEVTEQQQRAFIRQMKMLRSHARPVFADIACNHSETNRIHPQVAVSFDDGFTNVITHALPYMREQNIPATLFIPSGYLGQRPGWIRDSKKTNYHASIVDAVTLQQLSPKYVLIGSHSVSHANLTDVSDAEAKRQLQQSRLALEKLIGKPVTLFAFPYGLYNKKILVYARQYGYERVFAADPSADADDYLWSRVTVSPNNWTLEYWLALRGAYRWMAHALYWKRRLLRG